MLIATAGAVASPGEGVLASDESNPTCGKRLAEVGLENKEANCRRYRELLFTAPGLGERMGGAILVEDMLYMDAAYGQPSCRC